MRPSHELAPAISPLVRALADEHRAILRDLDEALADVRDGEGAAARAALARFETLLAGHQQFEERALYPLVEASSTGGYRATAAMLLEHRRIDRLVAELHEALAIEDVDRFTRAHEHLERLFAEHELKELLFLHPTLELSLTDGERAELLARARAARTRTLRRIS